MLISTLVCSRGWGEGTALPEGQEKQSRTCGFNRDFTLASARVGNSSVCPGAAPAPQRSRGAGGTSVAPRWHLSCCCASRGCGSCSVGTELPTGTGSAEPGLGWDHLGWDHLGWAGHCHLPAPRQLPASPRHIPRGTPPLPSPHLIPESPQGLGRASFGGCPAENPRPPVCLCSPCHRLRHELSNAELGADPVGSHPTRAPSAREILMFSFPACDFPTGAAPTQQQIRPGRAVE